MNWQERAEKAEAELARMAQQEPVAFWWTGLDGKDNGGPYRGKPSDAAIDNALNMGCEPVLLYARPIPAAPAVAVPAVSEDFQIAAQNLIDAAGTSTCSPTRCQYPMDCCKMELIGAMDAVSALLQSAPPPPKKD